jgi:hypothetical protein
MEATLSRRTSEGASEEGIMASLVKKYVWWKTPEEVMKLPEQIRAQVMNLVIWIMCVSLSGLSAPMDSAV